MYIYAGTKKGVFRLSDEGLTQVLESSGVREVTKIGERLFAGTGAGLYVSDNDGSDWTLTGLSDPAVWQVRDNGAGTLYAGTAPTGLFRSDDNGDTWCEIEALSQLAQARGWCIPIDPPVPAAARALIVRGPQLWVGIEVGGIAMSMDAGATWEVVLPGDNPDLHMMFPHPKQEHTLFASTGYGRLDGIAEMIEGNAGVFRSDDAGSNWTYAWRGITPRYSRPMCIDPHPPYPLTVASAPTAFSHHRAEGGAQAMLFRSIDGGESWYSLCDADHSPSRANFHGLALDAAHPGHVLVGTDTGEVWRVSDNASWTMIASGMPAVSAIFC